MNKEIIISDTRLLLFRALEYGLGAGLMDDVFLNGLKKDGAELSYVFAKRYYGVIQQAYLRHASHCVLGIINIGLIEPSDNLPRNAAEFLLKNGLAGSFREGWSRVLKLVRHTRTAEKSNRKTEFEWEKDFADSFCAEPGRRWIGYDEYRYYMLRYCIKSRGKNKWIR